MRRGLHPSVVVLPALLLLTSAIPSWAGIRIGFGGPRIGVYVGPGPWWGSGDYYDYAPDYSYQQPQSAPDNSPQDLKFLNRQIAGARDQINFEYQDGDIS